MDAADVGEAQSRGGTIRQLACAEYDDAQSTLTAWVAPAVVPQSSIFGRTTGPGNAAIISGEFSGEIGIFGAGAGGDVTAVAVLGDLLAIARDRAAIVPAPVLSTPCVIRGLPADAGDQRLQSLERMAVAVLADRDRAINYAEAV